MLMNGQYTVGPLVTDALTETVEGSIISIIESLPAIILAAGILGFGVYLAKKVRQPVERLVVQLNVTDRLDNTPLKDAVDENRTVVKPVVFIVQFYIILFAVLFAAEIADVAVVSEWAELLVRYVPELLGGGLIIVLGLLTGHIVTERMSNAPVIEGSEYGEWIVATTKSVIYFVAAVIGLEMIGFDLQIVYLIVEGIVSAIGLGIAAAIALAIGVAAGFFAKDYVKQENTE